MGVSSPQADVSLLVTYTSVCVSKTKIFIITVLEVFAGSLGIKKAWQNFCDHATGKILSQEEGI